MVIDSAAPPASSPPSLRRVREGRWVAGVCRGLALRWELNVVQVRALFVLATVLAGLGVLAYVACWLVLPLDSDDGASPSLVRGMATLALLAAAAAGLVTVARRGGTDDAVRLRLGRRGRGRRLPRRGARRLVGHPAGVDPRDARGRDRAGGGRRRERRCASRPQAGLVTQAPATIDDIPSAGYRTGLGDLLVDLRSLQARGGQRRVAADPHRHRRHGRGPAARPLLQPRRPLRLDAGLAADEAAVAPFAATAA